MKRKHTKENNLPWAISIENYNGTDYKSIKDCKGESAMKVSNAELILTACNNHHQLLDALEDMIDLAKSYDVGQNSAILERALAAIKKAKGE